MTIRRVAFYVSGHGFGHGTRAAAVAEALGRRFPGIQLHLVTDLPPWLFRGSLGEEGRIVTEPVDVGVVQATALREDLDRTLARLADFYPLREERIARGADRVRHTAIDLVISDIAPLGIAVAERAGVPAVLVENFTWAYVYGRYADTDPRFADYATEIQGWIDRADLHVRTEPMAGPGTGHVVVRPIARAPRRTRAEIRASLHVSADRPLVLVSMGGTPWAAPSLRPMQARPDLTFVVSGNGEAERRERNVILLPPNHPLRIPDLIAACDAVVGKAGYSTVAEVYHAGVPYGFVSRPYFPEAEALEAYVAGRMGGRRIDEAALEDGDWVAVVPELLATPRVRRDGPNGADEVAELLAVRWGG